MTTEQLIFFAFINKCEPLLKLFQSDQHQLIATDADHFTIRFHESYFDTDHEYHVFCYDMEDSIVIHQIQKIDRFYYMRIYFKCHDFQ